MATFMFTLAFNGTKTQTKALSRHFVSKIAQGYLDQLYIEH